MDGGLDGNSEGAGKGTEVGLMELGKWVGTGVGLVGLGVGSCVGAREIKGAPVGKCVGLDVGGCTGAWLGAKVGALVGCVVGLEG